MTTEEEPGAPSRPTNWAQLPVRSLAYVGDAVYELHVRQKILLKGGNVNALHRNTVAQVSASGQAAMVQGLLPHLSEDEQGVFRRARNHKSAGPRRVSPQHYQLSTAFEAVLGYLHLKKDFARLNAILALTDHLLEEELHAE